MSDERDETPRIRERLRERIAEVRASHAASETLDAAGQSTAASIAKTIGGAVTRASEAEGNTLPEAPEAQVENTVAIAEQLARDPVAVNAMNAEPLWQSRIVIGLVQIVIAILIIIFGEEWVSEDVKELVAVVVGGVGSLFVGTGRLVPGLKPFRWFGLVKLISKVFGRKIGV